MRRDTLSLEGSLAGIFHMHRNVPENYPVIVYVILSGLESTAKAYMPCATLGWMSEMFLWGLETWKRNWGETKSLVERPWSPGRVLKLCLKWNLVPSFCQLKPILGAHTNNKQNIIVNLCQLWCKTTEIIVPYFLMKVPRYPREFATCKSTARHSPHHSLF